MATYTIGIDFGSLSGRAVLVDTANGREVAGATVDYPHAVMDTVLAKTGAPLPPAYALQDPADYLLVMETAIPAVLREAGVSPEEVKGICIDFTCCTLLPVTAEGTPLCFDPAFADTPRAYPLLWKHHAAQKYADRMNEVARARGEKFLDHVGGIISSEWMFPKIYQVLEEAPAVYEKAAYFIDAADWITQRTRGRVSLGPATLYTVLGKFEKEGYIAETEVEGRRNRAAVDAGDFWEEIERRNEHAAD